MNCRKNSVGNSNKETTIPILLERYLPTLNEKKKNLLQTMVVSEVHSERS